MKKLLLLLLLAVTFSLNAQVEYVPFDQVKQIADQNAQSMWGTVYSADPIAYYSKTDELIGYRFTYSINVPFPDKEALLQRCRDANARGDHKAQWGIDEFGTIFVSARRDIGVIQDYTRALPPHYAMGFMLEDIAKEKIGDNITMQKAYYIDFQNQWFCYTNGDKDIYINVFPKVTAVWEPEFREIVKPLSFFCSTGNFDNEWNKYLNEDLRTGRAEVWIPQHDGHCKFYDWSYGCSPTAAAMLLSYWDYVSLHYSFRYSKLVDWYYRRWDGIQVEWDYQVPNVNKELAIAMGTDTVVDGNTSRSNIAPGYTSVCNTTNGYSFTCTHHNHGTDFVWYFNKIKSEIGTYDRPIHISIPGHSECCVAYDAATNLIGVHNTWWEGVQWINRNQLERVYTIVPGGSTGYAVEITHPMGDVLYNHNGSGETFYAGDVYEIRWDYTYASGSFVVLYYSTNHGMNWTAITTNTPNDGKYDWVVPPGINSSSCRIYVGVYSSGSIFSGADASIGNFKIYSGGSLYTLSEDVAVTTTAVPDYYKFTNTSNYWSAVGTRTTNGTDDWDIELHNNTSFNNVIAESTYIGNTVDFVVIDGNHTTSTSRGIKAPRWSGTSSARVEFEGGNNILYTETPVSAYWTGGDVVEMFDIHLNPGLYGFILDVTSGSSNLDFALYGSNGSTYYAGRSSYKAISNSGGGGGDEYFTFNVTTADWYGLCVWANDANSANYTLLVEPAGIWKGTVSNNWHNAFNWSGNIIPDATIDVTIPSVTPYKCWVWVNDADCKNMTIEAGTYFRNYDETVTIDGNLTINGKLMMDYPSSSAITQIYGDVDWNSGSTAYTVDQTFIKVYGDWNFNSGADVQLGGGVMFMGSENSFVLSYDADCSFEDFGNYKPTGYWVSISTSSTASLTIDDYFYIHPNATQYIYSGYPVIIKGEFYNNGHLYCEDGTVIFDGTSHSVDMNPGDFFNNITISSTGTTLFTTDVEIRGNLLIESGMLSPGSTSLTIKGNWTNTVGTGGFWKGQAG